MCHDTKIFELEKHQPSSWVSDFLTSFLSPEIYETVFNEGIDKEKKIIYTYLSLPHLNLV